MRAMKIMSHCLSAVLLSLCAIGFAHSQQMYFGGSFGVTTVDTGVNAQAGATLDDEDTSFKFYGGANINEYFGLEVQYANLGEASLNWPNGTSVIADGLLETNNTGADLNVKLEATSLAFSGVLRMPGEVISPFVKLGLHSWDVDATATATVGVTTFSATSSDDGTDYLFGFGTDIAINEILSARIDYEIFDFDGDDVDSLNFGLLMKF